MHTENAAFAQVGDLAIAHVKIVRADSLLRVNADATSVAETRIEREAVTDEGVRGAGKQALSFNKDLESLDILEAYTLKPDGRRIPVGSDGILVQSGLAATGTGFSWPGVEIRQITFIDVQKGDRVVWRYRLTTHKTALPGWARYFGFLYPWATVEKETIRIEAPSSLGLHVFADGYTLQKTQAQEQDVWKIEGRSVARPVEANIVNSLTRFPRVYVSTYKDYREWASLFAAATQAKAVVSPEALALAQEITRGLTGEHDKARAVYDWVRKNIRYVAVYVGAGGYVPHDVGWILNNRYGDCKDFVLLTMTLLKSVGVEAVPALLNTTNEFSLPERPIGVNHVIAYLPGLRLFADPTASTIPFGALPWVAADKPTAVALAAGAQIMRTPAFDAAANRHVVKSNWNIQKDGKAAATIQVESRGAAATVLQDHLQQVPAGMSSVAVQRILERSRLNGRGFATYPAVQRDRQTQSLKLELEEVRNLLNYPQAGSLAPHPRLNLPLYILNNMGDYTAERRDFSMICTPMQLREEFEVSFDPAYKLSHVPANIRETNEDGIMFEAQYKLEGHKLTGWRELTFDHGRHVCSPEQYASRRPVMERIARHLRAGLLYEQ